MAMAGELVSAPSIALRTPQTGRWPIWPRPRHLLARIELWLEAERDQLPLWLPVGLALGIAAWFGLPEAGKWQLFLGLSGAAACLAFVLGRAGRAGRAIAWLLFAACLGCALAWARSDRVAAPVLARPTVVTMTARVVAVARMPAKGSVRLLLAPEGQPALPPQVRVNF